MYTCIVLSCGRLAPRFPHLRCNHGGGGGRVGIFVVFLYMFSRRRGRGGGVCTLKYVGRSWILEHAPRYVFDTAATCFLFRVVVEDPLRTHHAIGHHRAFIVRNRIIVVIGLAFSLQVIFYLSAKESWKRLSAGCRRTTVCLLAGCASVARCCCGRVLVLVFWQEAVVRLFRQSIRLLCIQMLSRRRFS